MKITAHKMSLLLARQGINLRYNNNDDDDNNNNRQNG